MSGTMSILGLYNYDSSIFEGLVLPNGVAKETVVNNILMECAELEIIYSDSDFMKFAIKNWSEKELETWTSLNDTFHKEYNPIWNVDGTELTTETRDLKATASNVEDAKGDGSSKHKVNGFNDAGLTESEEDVTDTTNKVTNNGESTDKGIIKYEKVRGGNIGVTMTQQLLEAELKVRPKMNIYNYIIDSFKSRFCLLIY